MKVNSLHNSETSHHALHEVLGGFIGAIGAGGVGATLGGPLGGFVGVIIGAGMGACASWAAEDNAAELEAEDRSAAAKKSGQVSADRQ